MKVLNLNNPKLKLGSKSIFNLLEKMSTGEIFTRDQVQSSLVFTTHGKGSKIAKCGYMKSSLDSLRNKKLIHRSRNNSYVITQKGLGHFKQLQGLARSGDNFSDRAKRIDPVELVANLIDEKDIYEQESFHLKLAFSLFKDEVRLAMKRGKDHKDLMKRLETVFDPNKELNLFTD
jgi:hypothetical protein